jgi:uncharacterized cupin superfamily protein
MSEQAEQASKALLDRLIARAGQYTGRGVDAEGQIFFADLSLAVVAGGRSVQYRYRAQAFDSSEVLHDESGLIGIGIDDRLALMASASNFRHVFMRTLALTEAVENVPTSFEVDPAAKAQGPSVALVFAFGQSHDEESFRDEIRFVLYDDGRVGHAYSWGLAGGPFAPRSSVDLENVALAADERPVFVRHYTTMLSDDDARYPGSDELLSVGAPIGRLLGLTRIGIHVELLPTGRRTSFPHAELTEEELVLVEAGHPEVWLDGEVYRLRPGDVVGFPPGTGLAHTFINNAPETARLVVIGERPRSDNKIWYPLNPERKAHVGDAEWWVPEKTDLGPHDGLPDLLRKRKDKPVG